MSVLKVVSRFLDTRKRTNERILEILVARTDDILEAVDKTDEKVERLEILLKTTLNIDINNDNIPHVHDRLRRLQEAMDAQIGQLIVEPVKIPEDLRARNSPEQGRPIRHRPK